MTRATHFYARACSYGLNVVWQNMDGSTNPLPGSIRRFTTRGARDAWVEADPCRDDGRATREALTFSQIRGMLRRAERHVPAGCVWTDTETGHEEMLG